MNKVKYLQHINETIENGRFKDNWDSLCTFEVPSWYKNAKFGVFIHWGIYSVPAFNNEWYPRNMYIQGSPEYEHHIETYGKHKDFGYKDFIPLFKAEKFDAEEWAKLIEQSGARYVVPVAEHHDGFQMYKSEVSHFNASEMGPKRDILGELSAAFEKHNLVFCTSSHRVEHWFFMGHGKEFDSDIKEPLESGDFYWPAMPEYDHQDINSPAPTQEFMEDWLIRTCEIVEKYHPKLMYFDWWIQHSAIKPYIKKFAAFYYNCADQWGIEVAINYKHDAFMLGSAVVDVERGQFGEQKPYFWQTDTAVARNSWCYTETNDYKTTSEILCDLVDIVSKNGSLLLNIGPKADGSIPAQDSAILQEIGQWMKINGEAIYDSKVWRIAGEGPTKINEGMFTDNGAKEYTSEDIRFTVKSSSIYATVLRYPDNGEVKIRSFAQNNAAKLDNFHGVIKDISVLGFSENPVWECTKDELIITTKNIKSDKPVVFKIYVD